MCIIDVIHTFVHVYVHTGCRLTSDREVSLDYTALFSQGLFLDKADNSELSADRVYSREKSLSILKREPVHQSL